MFFGGFEGSCVGAAEWLLQARVPALELAVTTGGYRLHSCHLS